MDGKCMVIYQIIQEKIILKFKVLNLCFNCLYGMLLLHVTFLVLNIKPDSRDSSISFECHEVHSTRQIPNWQTEFL